MAWSSALRLTVRELIEPLLLRLGFARFPFFTRFMGALETVTLGTPLAPLKAAVESIGVMMQANFATKAIWAWVAYDLMAKIVSLEQSTINYLETKAKGIWDKHAGDLGNYLIEVGGIFMSELVAKATLQKTGVALNLHLALPLDAAQIELIGRDIGEWLALLANKKIGTSFVSLYPPERLTSEITNQVMAELTSGTRHVLSDADVTAFILQLNRIKDNELVQQFGRTVQDATGLGLPIPTGAQVLPVKIARRRAQLRQAQRNFRLTHKREYGQWLPK